MASAEGISYCPNCKKFDTVHRSDGRLKCNFCGREEDAETTEHHTPANRDGHKRDKF